MRKHLKTTKSAIEFCTTRRAKIWFDEWRDIRGDKYIPAGLSCRITIKRKNFFGKTLLKSVNTYIDYLNKIEGAKKD
jgi:hypothetical protein